jgi:hypothetical protein
MNWLLETLLILTIFFLINSFIKKSKIKSLKKTITENWGKQKKEEYFNFSLIELYFKNNKHKEKAYHIISDKCESDLDINEVFKFIDRTSSKIGQQYLYFKLRTIKSIESLTKFDTLTNLFKSNETLRLNCQVELSKLNTNQNYYLEELINGKQIDNPKIIWLMYLLSITSILTIVSSFFTPGIILLLIPIFIINMVFHYSNKWKISYYVNGVNQLKKSFSVAKSIAKNDDIKNEFKELSFFKKIRSIKYKTNFFSIEKALNHELLLVVQYLIELVKILFNIEYLVFYKFIDSILKERESIEKLYTFIGEIDSAISIASIKAGDSETCTPQFTKEKKIVVTEIKHPLITNCISNDLILKNKSLLLTGSNMSGKTTFIRTISVNSILAQAFNFCFAKEYAAPFLKIYSSIRISDDLLEDTSYYLKEVTTIKEFIEATQQDEPCLFVLDEIFKGTNTIERISGGKAILSYLNKKNHITLVSTHDIELTELLEKDNYELHHFSEQIKNEELIFDHKIKEGKLKTRNAIKILEIYNYPSEIITDAKTIEKTLK